MDGFKKNLVFVPTTIVVPSHAYSYSKNMGISYNDFLFQNLASQDYKNLTLDIATGYFNVGGWAKLFKSEQQKSDIKVRLFLGSLPSDKTRGDSGDEEEFLRSLIDLSENGATRSKDLFTFISWLKNGQASGRVQIRRKSEESYAPFMHAKTFLLSSGTGSPRYLAKGIVGSANLTSAGLGKNEEASVFTSDYYGILKPQSDWFEDQWAKAIDCISEVIDIYEKTLKLSTSENVFKKMLIEAVPYRRPDTGERDSFWLHGLEDHQKNAARYLYSILERYGGALLHDDVGLGKTHTAGALAKLSGMLGGKVVVVCPKSIEPTWIKYKEENSLNFHADIVKYTMLKKERSKFEGARLIILDEAHTLRNKTTTFDTVKEIAAATGCQVLLLTATPVQNGVEDLHSILSLFLKNRSLASQGVLSLNEVFSIAERESGQSYEKATEGIQKILSEVTIKRTRAFVRKHYKLKQKFPDKVHPHKRVYDNTPEMKTFLETFEDDFQNRLELAAYSPYRYLKELKRHREEVDAEEELSTFNAAHLIKLLMLKKLESSLDAFGKICDTVYDNMDYRRDELREIGEQARIAKNLEIRSVTDDDDEVENEEENSFAEKEKRFTLTPINLTEEERDLFEEEINGYVNAISEDMRTVRNWQKELSLILTRPNPKNEILRQVLKEIQMRAVTEYPPDEVANASKTIIFTSSKVTAESIRDWVENQSEEKIGSMYYKKFGLAKGGDSAEERNTLLSRFAPDTYASEHVKFNNVKISNIRDVTRPINLLISTDVLAEGVNLQQARNVIHYDLTWNPMRMLQRVGRVDRMKSKHTDIHSYYFYPETIDKFLHLVDIIKIKLKKAGDTSGVSGSSGHELFNPGVQFEDRTYNAYRETFLELQKEEENLEKLQEEENSNVFDQVFQIRSKISDTEERSLFRETEIGAALGGKPLEGRQEYLFCVRNRKDIKNKFSIKGASRFFLFTSSNNRSIELSGEELWKYLLNLSFAITPKNIEDSPRAYVSSQHSRIFNISKNVYREAQNSWRRTAQANLEGLEKEKLVAQPRFFHRMLGKFDEAIENIDTDEETREHLIALKLEISKLSLSHDREILDQINREIKGENGIGVALHSDKILNGLYARSRMYPEGEMYKTLEINSEDIEWVAWLAV